MCRVTDESNHRVPESEQRPTKQHSLKWWTSNIILCTVFVIPSSLKRTMECDLEHTAARFDREVDARFGQHPIDLNSSSSELLTSLLTLTPECKIIKGSPNALRILTPSVRPPTTIEKWTLVICDYWYCTDLSLYFFFWNLVSVAYWSIDLLLREKWERVY